MSYIAEQPVAHPARRKEIVEAARAIAAEQSWPAVTVRAIGARIGCSAPAIYQYFRDKDAILQALAAEAEQALSAAIDNAVVDVGGPAKRLRIAARALWDFALANRELYAVLFGLDRLPAYGDTGIGAPAGLRRVAAELAAKHDQHDDGQALADQVAATAHGFIALALSGRLAGGPERALALFLGVVEGLTKGLGRH